MSAAGVWNMSPLLSSVVRELELLGIDILYKSMAAETNIINLSVLPGIDSGLGKQEEIDALIFF